MSSIDEPLSFTQEQRQALWELILSTDNQDFDPDSGITISETQETVPPDEDPIFDESLLDLAYTALEAAGEDAEQVLRDLGFWPGE